LHRVTNLPKQLPQLIGSTLGDGLKTSLYSTATDLFTLPDTLFGLIPCSLICSHVLFCASVILKALRFGNFSLSACLRFSQPPHSPIRYFTPRNLVSFSTTSPAPFTGCFFFAVLFLALAFFLGVTP